MQKFKNIAAPGNPQIPGAKRIRDGVNFTFETDADTKEVSLLLYHRGSRRPYLKLPLSERYRTGRVYSVYVENLPEDVEYNYQADGKVLHDPCAHTLWGRDRFGAVPSPNPHDLRCGLCSLEAFAWEDDRCVSMEYRDMILYKLHVRGFSKVLTKLGDHKGTFSGIIDQISYLTDLGINAIELMPAYEFAERQPEQEPEEKRLVRTKRSADKVNYWGYGSGEYFAPKRSYCATNDPEREFCTMVKALHKAGIALIMEMFFPMDTPPALILHILHYWKLHYHVDGFHLIGDGVPTEMILRDALLADTFLMASSYDLHRIYPEKPPAHRIFAEYNAGFLEDMRRFLKSDEDMVERVKNRIGRTDQRQAVINFMAYQDGFTLYDSVSYNYKHNESNQEDNLDGSSLNYSWNCGAEGPTRKLLVRQLRLVQQRNAFAMMMLSQEVPMIYAGDEQGNTQKGNNNAYCQDNIIGWIDWKEAKQKDLLSFVKKLIAFRKAHPVLHLADQMAERIYQGKGIPVMSYHGERAWFSSQDPSSRLLGVLYSGKYDTCEGSEDDYIYVAYNFHWEERDIALPNLTGGYVWQKVIDTGDLSTDGFVDTAEMNEKKLAVGPRTIVVLQGMRKKD